MGGKVAEKPTKSKNVEVTSEVKPRLAKLGETITGRLNIHVPQDGPTKYYVNWCNRTHDNLLMDHNEMKKVFGTLALLKVGMYFQVYITHVPEHPKEHPKGLIMARVPCPKNKKKQRQRAMRHL